MALMGYAPYGRTGVYMLQEFCRRIGVHATDGDIRDLIRILRVLPTGHPLQNLLGQAPELQNEAAIADALLHPQDRAYSVPQFFDLIAQAGLKFGRWLRQAPYSAQCGLVAKIPQAAQIARLPLEEQYAAIELFRGTMIRHSAVVYRSDCDSSLRLVAFESDNWLNYVPIRMPDTICIQDQLPAGAAAVLINQTHTYPDIFLPIGETEKKLFDAINGRDNIHNIVRSVLSWPEQEAHRELTHTFFERLWWHDQVVFDRQQVLN